MVYEITCPHCHQKLEADSQWEGQRMNCPLCAGEFLLPGTAPASSIQLPASQPMESGNPLATGSLVLGILGVFLLPLAVLAIISGSLVLGILGAFLLPLAVLAIICGHMARSRARTRGGAGGGSALAGLILGYVAIGIVATLSITYMGFKADLEITREEKRRIACNGQLAQIGKALRIYAYDFNGRFPPYDGAKGLRVLLENEYLQSPAIFVCPSTGTQPALDADSFGEENCDYDYEGGHRDSEPASTPVACDRSGNHKNMGNILYVDGHVKGFAGPDWRKNLRRK